MINWLKDKFADVLLDLKRAHKSITVRVNAIALTVLEALPYLEKDFPALQEYISPEFYKQAMAVIIIANIILRFKTKSALKDR